MSSSVATVPVVQATRRGRKAPAPTTPQTTLVPAQATVQQPLLTEADCLAAMTNLRIIRQRVSALQQTLNQNRAEQKRLTNLVGAYLAQTQRETVRMGDLVVQAQTTTVAPAVNILTSRAATAQRVLTGLAQVGVTITPDQWGALVQTMRVQNARTKQSVRLITP